MARNPRENHPLDMEPLLGFVIPAVLGWGAFTWRRSEHAVTLAQKAASQSDKLELKVAELYLTKKDFELAMERLFTTLHRFEEKLDFHVYEQERHLQSMRNQLHRSDD